MNSCVDEAIQLVQAGTRSYCKFLTANDTGVTGSHQAGIHVGKQAWPILFDEPGEKGSNKDKVVRIFWPNCTATTSRFIYYGQKTRNEYRITGFGRGFPYLRPEYTGSLFILIRYAPDVYHAYVLDTEDDIESFFSATGLTIAQTDRVIGQPMRGLPTEEEEIRRFIACLTVAFPTSDVMSSTARRIMSSVYDHDEFIVTDPDRRLLEWTDVEYRLFQALEHDRYGAMISAGFSSVDSFISTANEVLNRRKSRAGKSLEHHLAALFDGNRIRYDEQVVTEGNKRPDFVFPSRGAYLSPAFPVDRLATLAAKTTCKDRWRQILNEADRLKGRTKYLCTLQRGISPAQMAEMASEQVTLVVPSAYIADYPPAWRDSIMTIRSFIGMIREMEGV